MSKIKLRTGLYIDVANMFYQGKRNGWFLDYKKLFTWLQNDHDIIIAKYFIGEPSWNPARYVHKSFVNWMTRMGYVVITKPLKNITSNGKIISKCNFDVEIHDEIQQDLVCIDLVVLLSGDSDFLRTKERVIAKNKRIKFMSYKQGCSWEIRKSWHHILDNSRAEIERKVIHNRNA
jgi:uncharacterized LabA/DUF88 family protein